jgi:hypothetical protein
MQLISCSGGPLLFLSDRIINDGRLFDLNPELPEVHQASERTLMANIHCMIGPLRGCDIYAP